MELVEQRKCLVPHFKRCFSKLKVDKMHIFFLTLFCILAFLSVCIFASISPLNMDAGFLYAQF